MGITLSLSAPGNWNRAALTDAYPPAGRWLLLLPRAGLAVLRLITQPVTLASTVGLALGCLKLGAWLCPAPSARPRRADGLVVLASYVALNTIVVVFLKTFWVDPLLGRVTNLLILVLLLSTAGLALWVGTWWQPVGSRWLAGRLVPGAGVVLLVVLVGVGQVKQAWVELLMVAPSYDQQMQARYALLRQARARGGWR
ncbi:hypothetical protein [Hymenobacter baengnokdamensis]|uniref:hypothetical protein n=1 Tax=Hymenobacter baengnokdamensis TaxID=2615203 RepID=UPI0012441F9B|nr:hypothetical protein [Hymenobacter baengnokdamensis]